ncbi:uncharacterized protein Z518_04560 [Rhinocladiella mackenziei CBS 650.93]|uniref:Rhinocladiella mackenziei CBS 650.93 unplaced genomic scaffold supercont1.3, whole genome shotgun sequence n=1 Tax=Rhinocladiella mackenziei CBS 650.93 TaxID=1442369 RepID=A0A0D2ILI2_9EURO|nr:uncharacterized protein Z518_04560 [Rhinocladiella mackenziei CBS 650.93]KIX06584.1 hypothetical protein Z518_04560 [Rhinocladiella mackenziei CBS 650.93]
MWVEIPLRPQVRPVVRSADENCRAEAVTAKWQQDIGPAVSSQPGPRPSQVALKGKIVTMEPLTATHAPGLYDSVKGDDKSHLWTYLGDESYASLEELRTAVTAKSESEDPLFFAIVHNKTKVPLGWAALMRIDAKNRVIEIGNILFTPLMQRNTSATEAMYIMAKYVFEDLRYRRYEWKCDNFNVPSKKAAIRLGFTFEGIFRQHMIYKNRSRDTAWFSMIDSDWPVIKNAFEAWLDDANFDKEGKQLRRLEELRASLPDQQGPVTLKI